jgi:hypothetical protein
MRHRPSGIARWATPIRHRPSGIAHPATPIWHNAHPATPIRQRPSGNAHPATPIRQCPSGNAHPATPIRQRPTGNQRTHANPQNRKRANPLNFPIGRVWWAGSVDRKVRASKRALFLNGAPSTGPLLLRFDVAVRAEAETLVLRLAPETTLSAPVRPARYPATAPRGENAI